MHSWKCGPKSVYMCHFPFCRNTAPHTVFELVSCGKDDTRKEIWDEQLLKLKTWLAAKVTKLM